MSGLFSSRSSTYDPLTSGQHGVADMLQSLASTGSGGGLTLGQAYDGSFGDFNQTDTQKLSSNKLMDLLNSASPAGYDTARNTLTGLANNQFNPDDPSSGYAAYSRAVARSGGVANDALNREAAITGDRYSTSIGQKKADLGAQMNDQLSGRLAELYNSAQDRSYNAANALSSLESQAGNNNRANLEMGFNSNQGGLQNTLNNAAAQAKYKDFMRQREEQLQRIGIGKDYIGRNFNTTTTKAPSIFGQMYGEINPLVGSYNTAKYGAANAPNQSTLGDAAKMAMAFLTKGASGGAGAASSTSVSPNSFNFKNATAY